jgi:tetratricopeptide (TPR) repeat protein
MLVERGDADDLPLPESVQGIIAARLDGLSGAEKALLQDASVVGKVFWLGVVRAIGGIDRVQGEEALLGLERKELAQRARRSSVEGEAEYSFRHLLVRDVAYGQIPRAARADKHRAAAEWVEGLGRPDDHAEMLASHYSRALEYARATGSEDPELVERARGALRDAGDRASSLQAWPAAARFYTEALELWPADDSELPHLRFRCGRARSNADGTGLDLLEASVNELEATGDAEAAAQAAVVTGRSLWQRGEIARSDEYIRRALELVGEREESAARVAAIAAQAAMHMFEGEFGQTIALADEGLPIAERLGLDDIRVRLLELRGYGRSSSGDPGGFADFEEAIALASEIHAFEQLHTALNNLAARQVALGQLEAAHETVAAMKRNAERHSTDARRRWMVVLTAEFHMMAGSWAEANRMTEEYIAESEAGSPHYLEGPCRYIRATIRRASGDLPGAAADMEQALLLVRRRGDAQLLGPALAGRGAVLIEEGRRDEASALAAELLEMGVRHIVVSNDVVIVDTAWLMRDLGLQDDFASLLEASPPTPWVETASAVCSGDFRRAADVLEGFGYHTGEAYARLRAAKQLVEEGRRAEADAELNQALAFYREVGATAYVREGEALLAESA